MVGTVHQLQRNICFPGNHTITCQMAPLFCSGANRGVWTTHSKQSKTLRAGQLRGTSDPRVAGEPPAHPPAQQEAQSQGEGPRWPAARAGPHTTCRLHRAWLGPSSVGHLRDNPSESQAPAEAQMASILHNLQEPQWNQSHGFQSQPSLPGCETHTGPSTSLASVSLATTSNKNYFSHGS